MEKNLNNSFEVRKATLNALGGDMTVRYQNIYEVDKAILKAVEQGGGMGAQIDDNDISTGSVWSSNKVNNEIANVSNNVYRRVDVDTKLSYKADKSNTYIKSEVDDLLEYKQDTLESGVNIKTINNIDITGAGNIEIGSGVEIDDEDVSTGKVWSSSKTLEKITELGMKIEIVDELPETGETKTIYLVPSEDEEEGNVYDEYIYINNAWERLGSTKIDLSQYYTKDEVDDKFEDLDVLFDEKLDVSDFLENEEVTAKALNKLNASIGEINNEIDDISTAMNNKVDVSTLIEDEATIAESVYFLNEKTEHGAVIDDGNISSQTVWSSFKTNAEIQNTSTAKQDKLISGTNIKTVDYRTILGNGNFDTGVSQRETKADANLASEIIAESEYNLYNDKVYSAQIKNILALTRAEYDDIETKDENTLYIITDAI